MPRVKMRSTRLSKCVRVLKLIVQLVLSQQVLMFFPSPSHQCLNQDQDLY
uniref:Uncharacterized protein n=1 Tax=Picea glauca TaxID=3330 RepID=A0A101M208_PICGL|nr:hypothetical protein ABT39_MTgene4004 [Picea glauca]